MLPQLGSQSTGRQRAILVVACVVLYMLWPLPAPITNVDEARYAATSRAMLNTGDYLTPRYNDEPRYQKPIMIYWLQAGSMALLGQTEVAARLPSALAGLALVLVIHWFLLRWLPANGHIDEQKRRGVALLGAFAMATMPLLALWARAATTDVVLTLFTTGALLALLHAQLAATEPDAEAQRQVGLAYLVASVCMALAFLTKGPVGIIIPLGAWIAYLIRERRLRAELQRVPWLWVLRLFIIVALPWYIAIYIDDGDTFIKQFLFTENVDRFTGKDAAPVPVPRLSLVLTYLPLCYLFLFPWSVFLVRDLAQPYGANPRLSGSEVARRMRAFCWVWMAVVIVFFSISRNQAPNYVQSILAAAAIVLSLHLLGRVGRKAETELAVRSSPAELVGLLVGALVWVGLVVYVARVGSVRPPLVFPPLTGLPHAQLFPQPLAAVLAAASIVLGLVLIAVFAIGVFRRRGEWALCWVAGTWALFAIVLVMGFSPMLNNSANALSVEVGGYLRDFPHDEPVWVYTDRRQDTLVFYAQRRLELMSRDDVILADELALTPPPDHGLLIVTDDRGVAEARSVADVELLASFDATSVVRVYGRGDGAGVGDRGDETGE